MSLKIDQYLVKADPIEAVEVTGSNNSELAQWCGGEPNLDGGVRVPTLEGIQIAEIGSFLIRNRTNKQFTTMLPVPFHEKYHKIGVRNGDRAINIHNSFLGRRRGEIEEE